ncbi:mannose-1-phosphate guanylyltransferase [Ruficoccus amylovorans]|uniref:mannose-1-phosphate guanylyltransferase n=1 Tax=Ruficoccus amylovorans TaxID=1804625 RepID=A0A842HGC7_9BACT|nr:sugar phosphate nucleotidyltransferase [Ruficoccus amylovorans]MBC2595078.1 mannose-1-phosphate guanylyltransferase [Ruficoccus amylovorans]
MPEKYVVIMAGGRGERFWPQSRLRKPKHLLPIVGETSMLSQTIDRLEGLVPVENVFVITNAEQRDAVLEVCPALKPENVIGEPVGRDTAPAVGLAALLVKRRDAQAVFAILPADHVIHDAAGFQRVLRAGFDAASAEPVLVTIGIQPAFPATGYGYIHKGQEWTQFDDLPAYRVRRFVEKPDLETARSYVDSGEYFWNAGMFIWAVPTVEAAFEQHSPGHFRDFSAMNAALDAGESLDAAMQRFYPKMEKISVDFALMEKADNVVTIPSAFDWDDVGEWPAIARHHEADANGNVLKGEAMVEAGANNIIVSSKGHLTAIVGADDLIVVHTDDATLVCPKSRAQEIKALVKRLGADEALKRLT